LFEGRRKALFAQLPDLSAVWMQSAPLKMRNNDAEYPYRQESYFYYLTGIKQPDVTILLRKQGKQEKFYVFCHDTDPEKERWIGRQMGHVSAKKEYGADEVYTVNELDAKLPPLISGLNHIYFFLDDMVLQRKMSGFVKYLKARSRYGDKAPNALYDLGALLAPLRLIKSPAELKLMRKAASISEEAHIKAMQICRPGMYEYELEAELFRTFYSHGSRYPAYTSIVAGGANACILHYVDNKDMLKAGDLVLIDAGAEYDYYASDITRTFPVNGKYSSPQQDIYEIVLNAQLAGIACIKKDVPYTAIQEAIVNVIVQGLKSLKIIKMSVKEAIETKAYLKYYMHSSGHWLGMDVHDVGAYRVEGNSIKLAANQVLTVEPGLYFDPADKDIPEPYRGIGIRIEDDIVVKDKGCDVLSSGIPKTISEVEKLMVHHGKRV
jgi:Xaa-Pro aminopeptidase